MFNTRFIFTADDLSAFSRDGFLISRRVLDDAHVDRLRARFDALFHGEFETGVCPDEVNWREGESDPAVTRQICNAWKADRVVARVVLAATIGEAIARLAGWSGARVIQDNVLWKPPGAGALGMHQDNAYLAWYAPREMLSCWLALDDTSAAGGALQFARGSHRWSRAQQSRGEFHAPMITPRRCAMPRARTATKRSWLRWKSSAAPRSSITAMCGTARRPTAAPRTAARLSCTAARPTRALRLMDLAKAPVPSTRDTAASPTTPWMRTTFQSFGAKTATAARGWRCS